jgi:hypothetical protein
LPAPEQAQFLVALQKTGGGGVAICVLTSPGRLTEGTLWSWTEKRWAARN